MLHTRPALVALSLALATLASDSAFALQVYWNSSFQPAIRRINEDGSGLVDAIPDVDAFALAADPIGERLYWTDPDAGRIRSATFDGAGLTDVVTGLGSPLGIDLDPVNRKLYWVDDSLGNVRRADLDGSAVEDIATGITSSLYGISVDPTAAKVYWAEGTGLVASFYRSDLDGANSEWLGSAPGSSPNGIAVGDFSTTLGGTSGSILWVDSSRGRIECFCNIPGFGYLNVSTPISAALSPVGEIEVDAASGLIYLIDASGRVRRTALDGPGPTEIVVSGPGNTAVVGLELVPEPSLAAILMAGLLSLGGMARPGPY